ncbi:MAG: RNA methyltransferase [Clostridia bacterium]|nr:RNA methyltransferase [Clostridia bacterium]
MIKEITSINNPTVKFTTSLKDKKDIVANNVCLVEGEKIVVDLINSGSKLSRLFVEEKKIDKFADLISKFENQTYKITEQVAKKMSDTVTNPGIFAIFELPKKKDFDFNDKFLVIDNLQDPSNLGAIIRSALAFGFKNIVSINSVFPYLPKVIRSSMGYVFNVNFYNMTIEQLSQSKTDFDFKLVSANLNGNNLNEIQIDGVYGLIIGNEGNGVSKALQSLSDITVTIPMQNNVESLNASVSASIIMYNLSK